MSIIRNGFESADLDVPVVLPTLNLDFANSQSLDSRITFTRGSIGTRVNRNGLIETIPANQPRFDFDPISGECRGLLIEESRTNLITYSEDFSQGIWTKTNGGVALVPVVTSNAVTSPSGELTADKVVFEISGGTTTTEISLLAQSYSSVSGTTYTVSAWVRVDSGTSNIFIDCESSNTNIVQVTSTWQRFSVTRTSGSSAGKTVRIGLRGNVATSKSATIYIWGAQLEAGSVPTSYIPTTTSAVTRSVDNVEMTGTNFSSWYNQSEGTFLYNGTLPFTTNDIMTTGQTGRLLFGVSNGFNFSNSMYCGKATTNLGLSFTAINNNVAQTTGSTIITNMTSSKFKIAVAVADKNIYSSGYGGAINKFSRPSATIPPATRLSLGKEPWNGSPLNPIIGCINKFAYYPKALSPAELQYLTQ
jgi:hypothetical protein